MPSSHRPSASDQRGHTSPRPDGTGPHRQRQRTGDHDDPATGSGQVVFRLKDVELVSQLIEGSFPDYEQIIPAVIKRAPSFQRSPS